jgi:hypothetical protein
MKAVFSLSFLLLLMLGSTSCTKGVKTSPGATAGSYMIIGSAGGFLLPTLRYYDIANGELKEDTSVPYGRVPDDITQFNFNVTLPAANYDSVKNLPSSVPPELLSRNNEHIGGLVPDLGYTDIRTSVNGIAYRWYFEAQQTGSSPAVQQFVKDARKVFVH